MPEIIENGSIVENAGVNTIILKQGNSEFRVGLSKGFFGKGNNEWVITSYEKKNPNAQNFDQVANSKELENGNNLSLKGSAENSTPKELKSGELEMAKSFSPELKASYEMRDKLLKSANEARAKLSQKGKDELDKLKASKDSKLSRDAQIMKTLENAKSNPARYEKLKKLYLDENGKVKDSIGLC